MQSEFTPIARPDKFAAKVRSLVERSQHVPDKLLGVFRWFVFDRKLPLYSSIIAPYMAFFWEESWFAQEHAPDYYGSSRDAGRPAKIDPDELVKAAKAMQEIGTIKSAEAVKRLAEQFGCSVVMVRQIFKAHQVEW